MALPAVDTGSCSIWVPQGRYSGWRAAGVAGLWRYADAGYHAPSAHAVSALYQHALMATREDVFAALTNPSIKLLDNRDKVEWLGESSSPYGVDFAPRKGRIPGAVWIEWYSFMHTQDQEARFKTPEEIRALAATRNLYPDDDIIIYCFKGARAANTYVALASAGFTKLRIYMGSWNEWSRHADMPIEDGVPRASVPYRPQQAEAVRGFPNLQRGRCHAGAAPTCGRPCATPLQTA